MKHCKLLLAAIISLLVPFFALSDVKASTSLTNATSGSLNTTNNTLAGYYYVYTATSSSGSYLQFYFNDKIYDYDQYHAASITDIQLNDQYDGYITLSFNSSANLTSKLVFIDSDGACAMNYSTQAINLTVNDCEHITVYVFTTDSTANNIQPTSISPTLQKSSFDINFDPVIENQMMQRWFPDYNLVGYLWGASYGAYQTLGSTYSEIPFVFIPTSAHDGVFTLRHRLFVPKGTVQEFYFLSTWWLTPERVNVYFEGNYTLNWSIQVIKQYASDNSAAYHTVYLHKFTIDGSERTGDSVYELEFTGNIFACPIYYGTKNQIPDGVALMLGTDYDNTYTHILQNIADSLAGNPNITPIDPDVYSDTASAISDTNTVETSIQGDFNNAMNNINLNDYGIGSTLYQSMVFLTDNLQQIFNKSGEFKILFTLPLVLGIALFFIGRGSVVFRQGNIDRAEFRNDMKNYYANEEADRIMGYEGDSRSTNVAASRVSHSRIIKRK